jgi:hypothetical protein
MDFGKLATPVAILIWPPENGTDPAKLRTWRRVLGIAALMGAATSIAVASSHIPPGWAWVGLGRVAWTSDLTALKRDIEDDTEKKVTPVLEATTASNDKLHHDLSQIQEQMKADRGATAASKIRTTQREICRATNRFEKKRLQDELDDEGRVYFDAMGREFNFATLACDKSE